MRYVAIAAVCFTLFAHLCSASSVAAQPTCAGSVVSADETVSVRAGQPFDVVLDTQPGTGYSWTLAADPDPAVVSLVGSEVLPPQTALPGATQRACFHFTAVAPGTAPLDFVYARPFDPDNPAQSTIVTVSVLQPQPPVQLPRQAAENVLPGQ